MTNSNFKSKVIETPPDPDPDLRFNLQVHRLVRRYGFSALRARVVAGLAFGEAR